MQIAEFQQWVRDRDEETLWSCLSTPQLLSHLMEEVGELARSVNRVLSYAEERQEQLANLRHELMDVFWFLVKIANRFDLDLGAETQGFVRRANEWPAETVEKYREELIAGLQALDQELLAAKRDLDVS